MKKVKWMALTMATMVLMSGCGDKKVEEFKVTEEDSIRKRELEINPGGFEITKNNDLLVVYNTEAVFMNWDGEELFTVEKAADPSMETQAFDICDTKFVCKNAKANGLKKLAIEFHNAYPEYTVNIELDNDETMTQQDRVRNLNARLLNGDGPDILMLDGMPIQSHLLIFGLLMVSTTHGYKMLVEDFTIYPVTVLLLLLMYSEQKTMRNSWMRICIFPMSGRQVILSGE